MDEIRKISGEINCNKLIYHFKTPGIVPINFIKFKGPFNTFKERIDGDKTLQEIEEDEKKLKSSLGEMKSRNPKHKKEYQLDTIKNVQSLYDSRQFILSIYLMIMQKLDLNLFINQNRMKQQEQDLEY